MHRNLCILYRYLQGYSQSLLLQMALLILRLILTLLCQLIDLNLTNQWNLGNLKQQSLSGIWCEAATLSTELIFLDLPTQSLYSETNSFIGLADKNLFEDRWGTEFKRVTTKEQGAVLL